MATLGGVLLLAGVLVALPTTSQAAACDMTVGYGHPATAHRTTTDFFTVCLTGAPRTAQPLLDVRAAPAHKSDSLYLELDKEDGTYLRSSAVGAAGATQRVGLAQLKAGKYEVYVDSGTASIVSSAPYTLAISYGPVRSRRCSCPAAATVSQRWPSTASRRTPCT